MGFEVALEEFKRRQIAIADGQNYDKDFLEAPSGMSAERISEIEKALDVQFSPSYRALLSCFPFEDGKGEFGFARMSELPLQKDWNIILDIVTGDGPAPVKEAIKDRQILPFGDDYSGRYWLCFDLQDRSIEGEYPILELNLDSVPEEVSANIDHFLEKKGENIFKAAEVIEKEFYPDLF